MNEYYFDYRGGEITAIVTANSKQEALEKFNNKTDIKYVVENDMLRDDFWEYDEECNPYDEAQEENNNQSEPKRKNKNEKTFKYNLEIEITIDEKNIATKYPNYRFNFGSIDEFADRLVPEESYEGDTDMSKDGLKQWGYNIKKKKTRLL